MDKFYYFQLPMEPKLFQELSLSTNFEVLGKGRKGNHLVRMESDQIPIVRTTTKYHLPAQDFSGSHQAIAEKITEQVKEHLSITPVFNNALIEIYNHQYYKMGFHSDQALDLASNSYIALFSCYENPGNLPSKLLRKLKVKNKTTQKEMIIDLKPNSVVLFSTETNMEFSHKIVLGGFPDLSPTEADNQWLGITFRQSKTFIHFRDNQPLMEDGLSLTLANEAEQKQFYRLRSQENKQLSFDYPRLNYTLNEGDLLLPRRV